ncbi:hypothetical protein [Thermoactinospora rubra]|uniref:hypothetical protein n=1 Tax=Thermoactinospora rubra TaxID=1088767 RepID=UPI000A0F6BDD|nr:hypothetical protein [Thermoactinospora rubra]
MTHVEALPLTGDGRGTNRHARNAGYAFDSSDMNGDGYLDGLLSKDEFAQALYEYHFGTGPGADVPIFGRR